MRLNTLLGAFLVCLATVNAAIAQTKPHSLTDKKAKKEMENNKWIKLLPMKPHDSTDAVRFCRQYANNRALWDSAFRFLHEQDLLRLPVGKYPISGGQCFAIVSEYKTRDAEKVKIEGHKKYIDLQYVISGKEKIGTVPVEKAVLKIPYDDAKDIAFYTYEQLQYKVANNSSFFLFFPGNLHQPGVTCEREEPVKKIVIKIQYAD